MSIQAPALDAPAPQLLFKRRIRLWAMVRELWGSRDLVMVLTERDLRVRYKQTKMGFAWAFLTPLLMMVVFTVFFGKAVDIDTQGVPAALFFYTALVPWTFFASSVSSGGTSITGNLSLVNKVYCPREVFPLASIATAAVDSLIAATLLIVLFAGYGEMPHGTSVWVPVLLGVQLMFTIGVALILSSVVVYLRDLRNILPMVVQFAMFATPVAYSFDDPEKFSGTFRTVAAVVNPLVPVIDGYRRTVLLGEPPRLGLLAISAGVSALVMSGGYLLFKRLETGFADFA
jgi:ABC-2 type transport system permease protein/lipopolysaccharide transport system permease protein